MLSSSDLERPAFFADAVLMRCDGWFIYRALHQTGRKLSKLLEMRKSPVYRPAAVKDLLKKHGQDHESATTLHESATTLKIDEMIDDAGQVRMGAMWFEFRVEQVAHP